MASQRKCNATTSENTRNTSSDAATKWYTLSDLHQLTFNLGEQTFDIETATPEQFQAFVLTVVGELKNVDVSVWPLEDRRDFVNALLVHCQKHGYPFPLTENLSEKLTRSAAEN